VSILEHYGVLASKIEKNTFSGEELMFFVNKLISTEKITSTKEGVRVTENHLNTSIQRLNTSGVK
jgi:hypothetical protein